ADSVLPAAARCAAGDHGLGTDQLPLRRGSARRHPEAGVRPVLHQEHVAQPGHLHHLPHVEDHDPVARRAIARASRIARYPCYTGYVGNKRQEVNRQNVTLVIEEDLLLAARKVALDQRTSVNQLVRDYLAALVEESGRKRLARARLKKAFETGLVEVGDRNWSRDDLYDR